MVLKISTDVSLPDDAVTQTLVVYGAKGNGKSFFGRVFAEELYRNRFRFSFLDPVGVNWGLRHGLTKNDRGLEILILGGSHGDIPIEPTGGGVVADLVADESISTVVDISRNANGKMWTQGEKIRFATDYATRLYERQGERSEPLMQIVDEAGRFVPQMSRHGDIDIAKCIGAWENLVELGRNVGVGVTLITQRSARMAKSVSELAECMVAFRTIGPNSMAAVLDWLGDHVEKERWKSLQEQLRRLPRGSALVVSPGWLDFEGVAKIRPTTTFDSSDTPKPGPKRRAPGAAKKPNLQKYLERMAQTVERVKENDPRALKTRIVELEKQLKARVTTQKPETVDVPIFDEYSFDVARSTSIAHFTELNEISKTIERVTKAVDTALLEYKRTMKSAAALGQRGAMPSHLEKGKPPESEPAPTVRSSRITEPPARRETNGAPGLSKCASTLLAVLAQYYPDKITKGQLAVQSSYSAGASTMANGLSELRQNGYLDGGGNQLGASASGKRVAPTMPPLPTGPELISYWQNRISKCAAELLGAIVEAYPGTLTKEGLEKRTSYSAGASTMANGLSELRKASLIESNRGGAVKASQWLVEG